jgi:iron complex transport system substrate-binding protein
MILFSRVVLYPLLAVICLFSIAWSQERLTAWPGYETDCVCTVLEVTENGRLIQHAAGETLIPLAPKRIVTLDQYFTDMLLSLGITPVAAGLGRGGTAEGPFVPYQQPYLEGVQSLEASNFEAILSAQPDLIIGNTFMLEMFEQYSRIAQTIIDDYRGMTIDQFGALLGMAAEAEAAEARYQQHVTQAREKLAGVISEDETVLFVLLRERSIIVQGYLGRQQGKTVYFDLGLTPHPLAVQLGNSVEAISLEEVPALDADHLFVITDVDMVDFYQELLDIPLFATLPAVARNQVYQVARDRIFNAEPIGRAVTIDTVVAALTGTEE